MKKTITKKVEVIACDMCGKEDFGMHDVRLDWGDGNSIHWLDLCRVCQRELDGYVTGLSKGYVSDAC